MHKQIGVGIIGAGFMGLVHSRAARAAGGRLVGVTDSVGPLAQALAGDLNFERVFSDSEELIADPQVEVVHVCARLAEGFDFCMKTIQDALGGAHDRRAVGKGAQKKQRLVEANQRGWVREARRVQAAQEIHDVGGFFRTEMKTAGFEGSEQAVERLGHMRSHPSLSHSRGIGGYAGG